MKHYQLIIIGGGPAGMTSALYSARSGLSTLLLESMILGGAMATAPFIENYPGFKKITGLELAQKMKEQVISSGAEVHEMESVIELELSGDAKKIKTTVDSYTCDALIIATGGERCKLNVKGEKEFAGKGVSYCAVCDGVLYKGKKVAVVGGGNCAAAAALYLSGLASEVYLIHRRHDLRCERVLKEEILNRSIKVIWNSVVAEIKGDNLIKSIVLENKETGEKTELEIDGLFIEIGIKPAIEFVVKTGIEVDEKGYIKVDRDMKTNIEGVYAAGDVTGGVEQIAVAVGEGTIAYNSAYDYLKKGRYTLDSCS
ncbi:MAG: thioredoxin-disulfide reductase [Candidatus Odinarchaeia archaeon]